MDIQKAVPPVMEAVHVAASAFGIEKDSQIKESVERILEGAHPVYSLYEKGALMGFAAFRPLPDIGLLYLNGIVLVPQCQGEGWATEIIRLAQEETGASMLCLKTQSPLMWEVGRRICDAWYPSPRTVTPGAFAEAAMRVFGLVKKEDAEFPVMRGGFSRGAMYGQKPCHNDKAIQAWWDRICDPEQGDAVLCVGSLPAGESR